MVGLTDSISDWIGQVRDGNDSAAYHLWDRFFNRILATARRRCLIDVIVDEEDIAISVFSSLCLGLRNGRYCELRDRNELWRLIVVMTVRKVTSKTEYSSRKKRDRSRLLSAGASDDSGVIENLVCSKPTPSLEAEMSDQIDGWFDRLEQDELKQIAASKLKGCTNEEIAVQIGRSLATVERKLKLIRRIWSDT